MPRSTARFRSSSGSPEVRLGVHHRTEYRFSKPVQGLTQLLRLTPASCTSQAVLDWRIDVDCDARLREARDGYGNHTHMLYVTQPVTSLTIVATGTVITEDRAGVVQGLPGDLPAEVFLRSTVRTEADEAIRAFAAEQADGGNELERLHALNRAVNERMVFQTGTTDAGTTAAQAFAAGRGVCQDFAHLFIAVARLGGTPARYVSGHLFRRGASAGVQDAGHAWAEAWVTDLGWVAFDPANGICADDAYVRIAGGLDYGEAAPLAGARRGGGQETLSVEVQVIEVRRRSQSQSQSQGRGRQSRSQSQSQSQG